MDKDVKKDQKETTQNVSSQSNEKEHLKSHQVHSRDLFEIDQQEGNMHNGELGGNFTKQDEKDT